MPNIGTAIKRIRQASDKGLAEVAKKAGISVPHLSQIESGSRNPSIEVVHRLGAALKIPAEALFIFMRENRIIGVLVILILLPFVYPSILGGLTQGNMNVEASWFEVEATLIASVILLALTTYLTRYLNKERVVTTIPSD